MRLPSTTQEARASARALASARVALGVTAFALPRLPARPWVGTDAARPSVEVMGRALGARDVALGLGALLALVVAAAGGRLLAGEPATDHWLHRFDRLLDQRLAGEVVEGVPLADPCHLSVPTVGGLDDDMVVAQTGKGGAIGL